ncbi:unnamed protein product, partial [Prorocentrum cordatum]
GIGGVGDTTVFGSVEAGDTAAFPRGRDDGLDSQTLGATSGDAAQREGQDDHRGEADQAGHGGDGTRESSLGLAGSKAGAPGQQDGVPCGAGAAQAAVTRNEKAVHAVLEVSSKDSLRKCWTDLSDGEGYMDAVEAQPGQQFAVVGKKDACDGDVDKAMVESPKSACGGVDAEVLNTNRTSHGRAGQVGPVGAERQQKLGRS